jgi:uncharacterized protein (UPF0335 family)
MVKTTVILDDDLYKRLVEEAIERYGSTRTLSRLINEKLREARGLGEGSKARRSTVRLGKELKAEEIEEMIDGGWREATSWKR